MHKIYSYVGPESIRKRSLSAMAGVRIRSARDLKEWLCESYQFPSSGGLVAVTFVVDEQSELRVADRHSEHIACSVGRPVFSAGELFLVVSDTGIEVREASNQSTGFCPEPSSWPAVAEALDGAGILHPGRFTLEVIFRRCPRCGERNVVKDGWFVCGMCGGTLPDNWNF